MTITPDTLGDIAQLAEALGLVDDNGIRTEFFTDPAGEIAGVLRDPSRLQALLAFLDQTLGGQAPPVTSNGVTWTPLAQLTPNVALYITTEASGGATVIGLGVKATTTSAPGGEAGLAVPLLLVPPGSAPVAFLPGSTDAAAVATLTVQADVSSAVLDSAGLTLSIPLGPSGQSADVGVTVRGLQLPGMADPADLAFSAVGGVGEDEAELAQLLTGLIQAQLASVSPGGDAAALLGVFGLDPGAPVPLPLANVATQGLAALEGWLSAVAQSPAAVGHWLSQVGQLLGASQPPGGSGAGLSWQLTSDITLSLTVETAPDAAGGVGITPVLGLAADLGGDPAFSIELSAGLALATAGPHPSVTALPALSCTAVYGSTSSPLLDVTVDGTAVSVGAVRAGVALDAQRRPLMVLAAESVDIGPPGSPDHHDVLDLTSPDALAQIGGAALAGLTAGMLSGLAPFGPALRILLGLGQPPAAPAGWPALDVAALFANPVQAVLEYHAAVLGQGATAYAELLAAIAAPFGQPAPAGSGTAGEPWLPFQAGGVALAVWTTGSPPTAVHVGAQCQAESGAIGGANGPSVTFALLVDALAVPVGGTSTGASAGPAFAAVPSVTLGATLTTPAATPLSATIGGVTLTLAGGSVTGSWTPGSGLSCAASVDGASIETGGTTTPLALPTADAAGNLQLPPGVSETVVEALLAAFLSSSGSPLAQTLPGLLGLGGPLSAAAGGPAGAAVPALAQDPVGWAAGRLAAQFAADGGPALQSLAASISALVTGAAPPAQPAAGTGSADDPYLIPIAAGGPGSVAIAVWADPDGPPVPASTSSALLQPPALTDWLSGSGSALSTAQIAQLLESASECVPELAQLLAGRGAAAAGWDALIARCAGGDGLLPGQAPDIAGSTSVPLAGIPHTELPANLTLASLGAPAAGVIFYVTGPYEPPWPDPALATIDLTTPGLAATAFDVSAVAGAGSWHVRLPYRGDCPGTDAASRCQAQADRLAAAVTAAGNAGQQVLLVAHGSAGGAAQLVAAAGAPVAGLVLLGVPAAAVPLDILDAPPAGDALALLRALLPAPSGTPDGPDLALARSVLNLLTALFGATADPNIDFAPPPGLTTPSVPTWSVRGALDATALTRAIGAVTQAALAGWAGAPGVTSPTSLRFALSVGQSWPAATSGADPTGVSIDVSCRLELGGLALSGGVAPQPSARIDAAIYRDGGWLVGGPQGSAPTPGVLRTPSLRRAQLTIWLGSGGPAGTAARITFAEGSALGTTANSWVLDGTNPLSPAASVLLGRLAAALSPVPATGPVQALAGLLTAAGLADPGTAAPAFGFNGDAVQQLLIDPAQQLASAFAQSPARLAAADALRQLVGDSSGTGGAISSSAAGLTLTADLGAEPPIVTGSLGPGGFALGAGLTMAGSASVNAAGTLSGSVTLSRAAPASSPFAPALTITLAAQPGVAVTFPKPSSGIPPVLTLRPLPTAGEVSGLGPFVAEASAAALLQLLLTRLRSALSPALLARINPVLASTGLLAGSDPAAPVIFPFGAFTDPGGWIRSALAAASGVDPGKAAALLDAVSAAFGITGGAPGALPLNSALTLQAVPSPTGNLELALACSTASSGASIKFTAGLALPANGPPAVILSGSFGPTGGAASLDLSLQGGQITAALNTGAATVTILPTCPGLGSLVQGAAQAALPFVLNALETQGPGPVPAALTAVRTTLGLGTPGFDPAQLHALAASPASEFASRLGQAGADALGNLFGPLLSGLPAAPSSWTVTTSGGSLLVGFGQQSVQITLGGSPPSVSIAVSGAAAVASPAVVLAASATADSTGLRELTASASVDPAQPLAIGSLALAPLIEVDVGPQASPPQVGIGIGWETAGQQRSARIAISLGAAPAVAFRTYTGGTADAQPDLELLLGNLLVPAIADLALAQPSVPSLLATVIPATTGTTIQGALTGVLLTAASPPEFDPAVLEPGQLPVRLATLLGHLSGLQATVADNLTVGLAQSEDQGGLLGLTVSVTPGQRAELVSGDLSLAIEAADDWVNPPKLATTPGLSVLFISAAGPQPPVIVVEGLGFRLYRQSGPLLDIGVQIGSVALYGLLNVGATGITDGGVALELADLAADVAAASGNGNPVAQGILGDAGQGASGGDTTALQPAFSPKLSVQQRQGQSGTAWSLSAGDGTGPWIINIDRSFGPLRVDDIGFGVTMSADSDPTISSVAVSISGGVSMLGLNLDLLDLSVSAPWPITPPPGQSSAQSLTQPSAWAIDLSGLDLSFSGGGVSLTGGLWQRDNSNSPPDYVGMLEASVGPYALTAFAGYGQFPSPAGTFTSLFVFAAINAPLGGPPAFFVTGLGGGAGINRALVLPTSLADFAQFPLVAALTPSSGLAADPAQAMNQLSSDFPPDRGTFWFAAGVAFTSFALIDVTAVLAVEVGDGVMVTLLGLATAALPTPLFPLAQVQLALMAEFSTAEGVLLVQAQLTDQSYLLDPACRLTGGFAYASWFGPSPNAGQFVITLGGYNPSFQHTGYPAVPRLGYIWSLGDFLTISGQSYFALTSDAIMAGTSFTAALTAGPAWASLTLSVDAIMYFDPFQFSVHGYASIAAGITFSVNLLFGTISVSLSFHLSADVLVEGPSIHGSASINLDVTSVSISFGSSSDGTTTTLGWDAFRRKYLTAGDTKPVLTAAPGTGIITPGAPGPAPDGSAANPWLVLPEFTLVIATGAATTGAAVIAAGATFPPAAGSGDSASFGVGGVIAIAPMGIGGIDSMLGVTLTSAESANEVPTPVFTATPGAGLSLTLTTGAMPKAIWAPQLAAGQIPTGDTVAAGTGLVLTARSTVPAGTAEISFNQVDVEPTATKTLPFALEIAARPGLAADAANAATFAAGTPSTALAAIDQAHGYLTSGPVGAAEDALVAATFVRNRVAPPLLSLVTDRTDPVDAAVPPTLTPITSEPPAPVDTTVYPPVITALLSGGPSPVLRPVLHTTYSTAPAGTVLAPAPSVAAVAAMSDPTYAWPLVRSAPVPVAAAAPAAAAGSAPVPAAGSAPAADSGGAAAAGLIAGDGGAATGRAGAATETSQSAITDPVTSAFLSALGTGLTGSGAVVRPGELLVTSLPNHERDCDATAPRPSLNIAGDAAVRCVALSGLGGVLADSTLTTGSFTVPQMTARLAIWCVGGSGSTQAGLSGWAATDRLPYIGCGVSLGAGAVISGLPAPDRGFRRAQAAVQPVAAAAASAGAVWTTLPAGTTVVAISLDATDDADLSSLSLGLSGAARSTDANGDPIPPTLVTAGGRGHLVYAVSPDPPSAPAAGIVVSVVTGSEWRLAGVLGGTSDVATIAASLAASGAAGCVAPLIQGPAGSATVSWTPASPPAAATSPAGAAPGAPSAASGPAPAAASPSSPGAAEASTS